MRRTWTSEWAWAWVVLWPRAVARWAPPGRWGAHATAAFLRMRLPCCVAIKHYCRIVACAPAPVCIVTCTTAPAATPPTPPAAPPCRALRGQRNLKPARKTKIVCTIGPTSWTREAIFRLAEEGMNVVRLNMSHGTHESHKVRCGVYVGRCGLGWVGWVLWCGST